MPQVRRDRLRMWLLGTVGVLSAGPALAQTDPPRLDGQAPSAPAANGSAITRDESMTQGPGALGGRLAQPGGTTRDADTNLLPGGPSALGELPPERPAGVDRGVTVVSRSRPEYDPIGLRLGTYTLQASAVTTLGLDSNVFRQATDGVNDAYGSLRAAGELRSDYARHSVELDAFADQRVYANYGSENALTYGIDARGRLDLGARDTVTVNVVREHQIIQRGAVGEVLQTRRPIRYDLTGSGLSGRKVFGTLTVDLAGRLSRYNYQDARDTASLPVDQDFRNFTLYEARADFAYAGGGAATLFASVAGEARRFGNDVPPIERDSDLVEVLGGVRGEITPLIRGQFGLGYIYADFKDPTLNSLGGLGVGVGLEYLVTQLTTIQLSGRRRLQNVGSVTAPASLTTELRLGADHELLRNLIVTVGAGHQNADYVGDRQSATLNSLNLGARYLVNRRFRLNADIDYRRRDGGGGLAGDFERVRASASVTVAL